MSEPEQRSIFDEAAAAGVELQDEKRDCGMCKGTGWDRDGDECPNCKGTGRAVIPF